MVLHDVRISSYEVLDIELHCVQVQHREIHFISYSYSMYESLYFFQNCGYKLYKKKTVCISFFLAGRAYLVSSSFRVIFTLYLRNSTQTMHSLKENFQTWNNQPCEI